MHMLVVLYQNGTTVGPMQSYIEPKLVPDFTHEAPSNLIQHGCLSARYLFSELKRYERDRRKTESTARLVHELYFRDFVRFSALIKGSKIFKLEGMQERRAEQLSRLVLPSCHVDPWLFIASLLKQGH